MTPTGRRALRAAQAVAILLVCAGSFELATRVDDWVRFKTPVTSPVAVEEELLTRDALGEHGRARAQYQKWVLNNLGMRGPDVTVAKPANVVRIVTAGASETFGLYESVGREYPRQLEDSLQAALAAANCAGVETQVLNAAIFGMTLPTVTQDLERRIAPLRPDVVVLYPTPVQYLADDVPRATPPADSTAVNEDPWYAVLRPRAASELRTQLKEILPAWTKTWLRRRDIDEAARGRGEAWRYTSVPPDRLASYDQDLRRAIGVIRAIGAVPVVMTHADLFMAVPAAATRQAAAQLTAWERFYPRATASTIVGFDSAAVAVTARAVHDSGGLTVDLATIVRDTTSAAAAALFGDYAHFTDAGSALVAHALRPAVLVAAGERLACAHGVPIVAARLRPGDRR